MANTQNSTSLLQTAEGAFGEVTNMLVRMKDLATQAADASSNTDDKEAMQALSDHLLDIRGVRPAQAHEGFLTLDGLPLPPPPAQS